MRVEELPQGSPSGLYKTNNSNGTFVPNVTMSFTVGTHVD
jgi:hypothetical protein